MRSTVFFYDIFMVFVSPVFFEKSVMVAVATAGAPTHTVGPDGKVIASVYTNPRAINNASQPLAVDPSLHRPIPIHGKYEPSSGSLLLSVTIARSASGQMAKTCPCSWPFLACQQSGQFMMEFLSRPCQAYRAIRWQGCVK